MQRHHHHTMVLACRDGTVLRCWDDVYVISCCAPIGWWADRDGGADAEMIPPKSWRCLTSVVVFHLCSCLMVRRTTTVFLATMEHLSHRCSSFVWDGWSCPVRFVDPGFVDSQAGEPALFQKDWTLLRWSFISHHVTDPVSCRCSSRCFFLKPLTSPAF